MLDFGDILLTGLIAGGLAGGTLGTLHHQFKPYRWNKVYDHVIGSFVLLVAFSGAVAHLGYLFMAVLAWEIWGIGGGIVILAYLFDWVASRTRKREIVLDEILSQHARD